MQPLRFLAAALLVWCEPYYTYVPVTSATFGHTQALSAPVAPDASDASGELPSTAQREGEAPVPGGIMPFFFPFFPLPPIDIGRGYDPNGVPPGPGYPPRYRPLSPAYGPGGSR